MRNKRKINSDPQTFGEAVIEALEETMEHLRRGEPLTQRLVSVEIRPGKYTPRKISDTRHKLGVSQAVFAKFLGTSLVSVQSWEQGARVPSPMARRFLDELNVAPEYWRQRLLHSIKEKSHAA